MKKFAYAASLVLLTGVVAGVSQTAIAQSTPTTDAPAATSASVPATLTADVTLASQYHYRGIVQTNSKPAVQGGFDYAIPDGMLPEGFYIGSWSSSINWSSDSNSNVSTLTEMGFYGGYKTEIVKNVPIDVGVLRYYYPGSYPDGFTRPHTIEGHTQIGYGPVTFKYSYMFSNLFGTSDSHHGQYFGLSDNFDTGFWSLTLNLHTGYQQVPHQTMRASYTDQEVGMTKDFSNDRAAPSVYIDTNALRAFYTNTRGNYTGKTTTLLSITRIFQ